MVIMVVAGVMINVFTVVFCTEVCGACMVWLLLGLVVVGLVGVFVCVVCCVMSIGFLGWLHCGLGGLWLYLFWLKVLDVVVVGVMVLLL